MASSPSSNAKKTSSSPAPITSTPATLKRCFTNTPKCWKPPSSARLPPTATAQTLFQPPRPSSKLSSFTNAAKRLPPTNCSPSAASDLMPTKSPARSSSAPNCPKTSSARYSEDCWLRHDTSRSLSHSMPLPVRNHFLVKSLKGLSLHGHAILIGNQRERRIRDGVLHRGKDAIGGKRLQGSGRPLRHEGGVIVFVIGIGLAVALHRLVSGIIPLGNHDGQRCAKHGLHNGARIANVRCPLIDAGKAEGCRVLPATRIFVPAHGVGPRIGSL